MSATLSLVVGHLRVDIRESNGRDIITLSLTTGIKPGLRAMQRCYNIHRVDSGNTT